jgi:protein-S-isoprenylcysteine O-methyltransferase Ste14
MPNQSRAGRRQRVVASVRKIRIEDRVLSAEFGPAYEAYRKRTAALIPWVL